LFRRQLLATLFVALGKVFTSLPTAASLAVVDLPNPKKERRTPAVDWRHRSACLDEDPELFFPIGNTGPAILQIEEAKQVCRRCEVREQCLSWALEAGQDHGVWGGLSEDERRALKRRNARARIRTA
jgi:WhiB family redox-sensing transcriptional regulator